MPGAAKGFALAAVAGLLTACGGGGGSAARGTLVPAPAASALAASPVPTSTPTVQPTTAKTVVVIDSVASTAIEAIHRHAAATGRAPSYVSPSSLGIVVTAAGISPQVFDVSGGSSLCAGSGSSRACSLPIKIGPGTYTFTMTVYDAAPVSGAIPGGAHALSTGTVTQTIVANTANTINFFLGGIVAGLQSSGASYMSLPADGAQHTVGVGFVATDADGNAITTSAASPYVNPVTVSLAESGGAGHTSLLVNGASAGTSATLTQASQSLAIVYDGGGSVGYTTVTSTVASGAATSSVRVSPMYSFGSLSATDAGQTVSASVSEASAPASVNYGTNSWSCTGFSALSTSGSGAAASVSTSTASAVPGQVLPGSISCPSVTISDSLGTSVTVPASASVPLAPTCAAASNQVYLGARSGSAYVVGNGSPCALSVSAATAHVYAPPTDGTVPTMATVTISEANDPTTPSIDTSSCTQKVASSVSAAPGTYNSGMSGSLDVSSIPISSATEVACVATVYDGNGQSAPVTIYSDPDLTTPFGGASKTISYNCSRNVSTGIGTCKGKATNDLGFNSVPSSATTFTAATNAVVLTLNATLTYPFTIDGGAISAELTQGGTSWCIAPGVSGSDGGGTVSYSLSNQSVVLPNGPGTYEITFYGYYFASDPTLGQGSYSGTFSWSGSAVTAPSNTGAYNPPVTAGVNGC